MEVAGVYQCSNPSDPPGLNQASRQTVPVKSFRRKIRNNMLMNMKNDAVTLTPKRCEAVGRKMK